jgi:hypothetical protein
MMSWRWCFSSLVGWMRITSSPAGYRHRAATAAHHVWPDFDDVGALLPSPLLEEPYPSWCAKRAGSSRCGGRLRPRRSPERRNSGWRTELKKVYASYARSDDGETVHQSQTSEGEMEKYFRKIYRNSGPVWTCGCDQSQTSQRGPDPLSAPSLIAICYRLVQFVPQGQAKATPSIWKATDDVHLTWATARAASSFCNPTGSSTFLPKQTSTTALAISHQPNK